MVTIIVKMKVKPEKHKELFQTVFFYCSTREREERMLELRVLPECRERK
ncbi:conserved hypothetical protein [delta proteobacterium NaphS2]|nr:conserved hypothetical protein [delta proteobacterium NaphS2]